MKLGTLDFLNRYREFAADTRSIAAQTAFNAMSQSRNINVRGALTVEIIKQVIEASEDLTMWLAAVREKDKPSKHARDAWEYLLLVQATDQQIESILKELSRFRTAKGLLRHLNLPTARQCARAWHTEGASEQDVIRMVEKTLIPGIKAAYRNRTISRKVLLRFHNKIKHGNMALIINGELFVRDMKVLSRGNPKQVYRKNRNLYLPINTDYNRQLVNTVEATSQAIKVLILLFWAEFCHEALTKKGRRTRVQRKLRKIILDREAQNVVRERS